MRNPGFLDRRRYRGYPVGQSEVQVDSPGLDWAQCDERGAMTAVSFMLE